MVSSCLKQWHERSNKQVIRHFSKKIRPKYYLAHNSINRKITLHDLDPDIFRLFVKYLYTGSLPSNEINFDECVELAKLADLYEVCTLLYQHLIERLFETINEIFLHL